LYTDKVQSYIQEMAQKAVEDGKSFSKKLDFYEKSITDIESILELYHSDLKGSAIKNFIKKMKKQMPPEEQV